MILLLLCLALALTGCSALLGDRPGRSPGAGSGGNTGGAGKPIGGGGAVDPPQPILDGAIREKPDPTVVDARGQTVDHFVIGPDGRTVVVYWWGGTTACFGLKEVMVEVQNGTPIFTVLEGTRGDHVGAACTAEAALKSAVVTLDGPILADAAGDQPMGEPQLPGQPSTVEPVPGVVDALPHAVTGYSLSADGLTLSVYYVGGVEECNGLAQATALRDADGLVTVSIREGRLPEVVGACDEIGVAKVVEIALDEPLIAVGAFDSDEEPATY